MTASEIDENILRRHFVAIATATYDDPYLGNLPEARDEVQALAGWFCSKGLADRLFTHQYPELATTRRKHRYGRPAETESRPEVAGIRCRRRVHHRPRQARRPRPWLALRSTETDDIRNTAVRTADLIGWLTGRRSSSC